MRAFLLQMCAVVAVLCAWNNGLTSAMTSIEVSNMWHKEVNIKIEGEGVGGCDVVLPPNTTNQKDCECLWGTLNYKFYAFEPSAESDQPLEILICSDKNSIGNCYHGSYSCAIFPGGPWPAGPLCHCNVSTAHK
eukprot:m.82435 g.82435  ORF g.82435 m.82435 type:complete len:134 (+) comp16333_c0_seq2:200-601(+)